MEYRNLGGIQVPIIGMGTFRSFDVSLDSEIESRREIIANCIESGVTFIDSSPMYGHAERIIGLTTEGRQETFQLATKVWTRGRRQGEEQIEQSFQLMKADHIDVFQIHNLLDWQTHLDTLERLKDEGRISVIGITHYTTSAYPEMMRIMRSGRIGAVQVPYNVGDLACANELLPLAEELGIGVIVMEPLGQGRFLGRLRRQPNMESLAEFGIDTWAQALLAWVVSDRRVSVAIPATSRPERIIENAKAGDAGHLTQDIRDYIREETMRCL
ncbi:MAG: aldo/keto reductase [SAR202 cluster bacterium]|nr:aldo/keto reductase [SAR202 cluster bacterium]MDP6513796.1 aldo/keto reductase [SAR202 cluster bacterium]MDP6714426.1 aldo/keto reductase [SAR202 cluster bacterium]